MNFSSHRVSRVLGLALGASIATIALPATVGAQEVRAVMHSAIRVLDPIITTAHITRNHGYMIYDTLLGMDSSYQPRPQMADWTVSDDGLVYRFTLREGLTFPRWRARHGSRLRGIAAPLGGARCRRPDDDGACGKP